MIFYHYPSEKHSKPTAFTINWY